MAVDITTIGLGVETSKLKAGTRELDNFGKSADTASRKADNFTGQTQKLGKESSVASAALSKLGLALGAFVSVGSLIRTVDEYTKFNAQLKLATRSQSEYNTALSDVNRIAATAQASISAIGTLYARLNNALRDVGVSQTQVGKITETVGLALKVSGATAAETASAMLQLSQAFGSGVLRGEEFNAVNEAAPALMRALAESIGVPIGALREMATEGQLTADVLAKAFGDDNLLNKFREQAKEVQTLSGAWQAFKNKFIVYIGEMDAAVGASKYLAKFLNFTGETLFPTQKPMTAAGEQAELAYLSRPGALGVREETRLKRLAALRAKLGLTGNQVPGMNAVGGGNISPNFGATVEAQDIDKIHRQQEEVLRIKTEADKKYADQKKKYNDELLDDIKRDIEFEEDLKQVGFDKEIAAAKELEKQKKELKEEAAKADLKRMEWLQDQANANFKEAQDLYKKAEEERLKEFEKTVDGINQVFREGFAGLVNGGKSTWKSFTKSLFTTFKTTVADAIYKLLAQPFVIRLVASILGVGGSGAASAGGLLSSLAGGGSGGGSIMGSLSSLGDIFSTGNASVVSSIESLGTFLSTGTGGLGDMLGGFIGEYAGQIANVLPYAGAMFKLLQGDIKGAAFTAVGTAIGSIWGPIGGAIGGFLGNVVGGLFGGKDYDRFGSQVVTSSINGSIKDVSSGKIYDKNIGANSQLSSLNSSFLKTLTGFITAFGDNSNASVGSGLYQRGKSKVTGGLFNVAIDGKDVKLTVSMKDSDPATVFQALVEKAFGEGLAKAIQSSKLSDGVKKFFDGLTKKEDVADAINTLIGLKTALVDLPPVFAAIQNAIDTTAYKTSLADLKARFTAIGTYTSLFYSAEEQFTTFTAQLQTQLNALGVAFPQSRDGFRSMVDGISVTDEATSDLFHGLVALAPAMDAYFKQLEAQKAQVDEMTNSLRDLNSFTSLAEYRNYRGVANNYGTATALDYTANARTGAISVNSNGKASASGDSNVAGILIELRDLTKQLLTQSGDGTSLLQRFDRVGIPART